MNEYLLPIHGNAKSRATAAEWEHFIKAASASGFFDGGSEVGKRMIVGDQMSAWSTNHIVGYLRLVADDRLKLLHVWKHTRSCGMAVRWNYVNCPSRDRPAVCGGESWECGSAGCQAPVWRKSPSASELSSVAQPVDFFNLQGGQRQNIFARFTISRRKPAMESRHNRQSGIIAG